ncbi:MAG: hypothetical protein RL301_211 [Actinomycetota bacterium]
MVNKRPLLTDVSINGIGVISAAHIELKPGFTVITGETGAGKTMILTALNLVLGGKADAALVRHGSERAVASATFEIPKSFSESFEERGVIVQDSQLVITRTVNSDGKSKANAGGIAVAIGALNEIADDLVMIHGQAASQTLTKTAKHRELLDGFGGYQGEIENYQSAFNAVSELKKRIKAMKSASKERESKLADLEVFKAAITKLNPQAGELTDVNDEINKLSSVEELRIAVSGALNSVDGEELSALAALNQARKSLEKAAEIDSALASNFDSIADAYFQVQEAVGSLSGYLEDLAADPSRLDYLQQRKSDLTTFIRKFGDGGDLDIALAELIERRANLENEISDLSGGDDRIKELENELVKMEKNLVSAAADLTKARKKAALSLEERVSKEIHSLSMPNTNFKVQIGQLDNLDSSGGDDISFLLQTHAEGPLVSIAKGASGGELSRVALAIEVVIAESENIGTYVFDEVDAGVGGKAAIEVGRRLKLLSKNAQVIVVTHLPQVAAWADSHFVVAKDESGSVSQSQIEEVTNTSRVEELARMLAGHETSENALKHAAELLAESKIQAF